MSPEEQERQGLAVRLDTPAVEAGGTVRGELVLEPHERVGEVKALTLSCVRVLEGARGPRSESIGAPVTHAGQLTPPARVPFAFTLPAEGPVTWSGQYVSAQWRLHLRLETSRGPVEWTEPFQVVPRQRSQLAPSRPLPPPERSATVELVVTILLALGCWLPCLGSPFLFLSMALSDQSGTGEKLAGWALALVSLVGAIGATNYLAMRARSVRAFRSAELLPQRESFALGSTATVLLALHLKRRIQVESATVRFWTRERVDPGPRRADQEHTVHEWTAPLFLPSLLEGRHEVKLEIPIPEHLPPSFQHLDVRTESFCEVVVKVPDTEDLKVQRELTLAPERLVPAGEATETAPPR